MISLNKFIAIRFFATCGVVLAAVCPAHCQTAPRTASNKSTEMLANGSFAGGTQKWKLELAGAAKGTATVAKDGPAGAPALQVKILSKGEQSWQVQLHQGGLKIQKGRKYTLTYWAKADRPSLITVNCMQNHEPWEHHGAATETQLTSEWKKMTFSFLGPWDDTNARITFTNLGTVPGQTYWFSKVSLKPGPAAKTKISKMLTRPSEAKRVNVGDGQKFSSSIHSFYNPEFAGPQGRNS